MVVSIGTVPNLYMGNACFTISIHPFQRWLFGVPGIAIYRSTMIPLETEPKFYPSQEVTSSIHKVRFFFWEGTKNTSGRRWVLNPKKGVLKTQKWMVNIMENRIF